MRAGHSFVSKNRTEEHGMHIRNALNALVGLPTNSILKSQEVVDADLTPIARPAVSPAARGFPHRSFRRPVPPRPGVFVSRHLRLQAAAGSESHAAAMEIDAAVQGRADGWTLGPPRAFGLAVRELTNLESR